MRWQQQTSGDGLHLKSPSWSLQIAFLASFLCGTSASAMRKLLLSALLHDLCVWDLQTGDYMTCRIGTAWRVYQGLTSKRANAKQVY